MHENDLAYTAGFFDAEGSIVISKEAPSIHMIHFQHRLHIKLGSANRSIINWLKYNFGGSAYFHKKKREHRGTFYWQTSSTPAANFLQQILLYLQIKKPQAELGLQLWEAVRIKRKRKQKEITPELFQRREQLRNQVSLLNRGHFDGRIKIANKFKIAYAAGFLDGDGYITIHIRRFCQKNTEKNPIYCLVVGSACLDQLIINWLKKNFGGSKSIEKSSESIDIFRWRIGANKAMNFLEEILPHLRLKVPQAELGIRFQKMNRNNINKRMRKRNENKKVSPEFLQRREQFRQQMLALNRGS